MRLEVNLESWKFQEGSKDKDAGKNFINDVFTNLLHVGPKLHKWKSVHEYKTHCI
jgi:hypothetical protein